MATTHTLEDVQRRMAELKVDGWSSLGEFTPDEQMEHLDEIEKILQMQKAGCAEQSSAAS